MINGAYMQGDIHARGVCMAVCVCVCDGGMCITWSCEAKDVYASYWNAVLLIFLNIISSGVCSFC